MIGWQSYLDDQFPDGALVEWSFGDRETDPICHACEFIVVEDAPAPLVWWYALEGELPQALEAYRFSSWTMANGIATVQTPDVQLRISSILTDWERRTMAEERARNA